MVDNLRAFQKALQQFSEKTLPEAITREKQSLAKAALRGVVSRTPTKTGRARANWQVTLNRPAVGRLDEQDPNGAATISRGEAVIDQAGADQTIWITNNLPYAEELENGRSDQAPAGMVAATLAAITARRGGGRS